MSVNSAFEALSLFLENVILLVMAQEVVDLTSSPAQDTPAEEISSPSSYTEIPEIVPPKVPDSTRLESLMVEDGEVSVSGSADSKAVDLGNSVPAGVKVTTVDSALDSSDSNSNIEDLDTSPLAPEEVILHRNSRIVHVLLSLIVILLVVGGAALAAYFYSSSDATFIKLPKLPFIKEPQSVQEKAEELATETPESEQVIETEVVMPDYGEGLGDNDEEEDTTLADESVQLEEGNESSVDSSKGGVTIDTSNWKFFTSKKWQYSFKYPDGWFLYPRDTGLTGESSMVAYQPLSSLENDVRQLTLGAQNIVMGVNLLSQDKPTTQSLLQYIKEKSSVYGLSQPEEITVGGRVFVRALSLQGGVLYYYLDSGVKVYAISIKPADYASSFADQVEAFVSSLNLSPQ